MGNLRAHARRDGQGDAREDTVLGDQRQAGVREAAPRTPRAAPAAYLEEAATGLFDPSGDCGPGRGGDRFDAGSGAA